MRYSHVGVVVLFAAAIACSGEHSTEGDFAKVTDVGTVADELTLADLCPVRAPRSGYVPPTRNGCTGSPDRFGRASFTTACNVHDRCYDTCNESKASCDQQFFTNLMLSCRGGYTPGSRLLEQCRERARTYFRAVTAAGDSFYANAQAAACECCGPTQVACSNDCVDLQTDSENCGVCGKACAPTESCERGLCDPNVLANLDLSADPAPFSQAPIDQPTPFLFYVENTGPDSAQGVVVDIALIGDMSGIEADFELNDGNSTGAPAGDCSLGARGFACTIGTLAPGEYVNITGSLLGHSVGTGTASAIVTSTTEDPDWSNDTAPAGWSFYACDAGLTACDGGDCVDLDADQANCGICGNACSGSESCVSGSCCAPLSVPQACVAGQDCGAASDGCGGTLDCGACSAPETCGGSGIVNQCGCPQACTQDPIVLFTASGNDADCGGINFTSDSFDSALAALKTYTDGCSWAGPLTTDTCSALDPDARGLEGSCAYIRNKVAPALDRVGGYVTWVPTCPNGTNYRYNPISGLCELL